MSTGPYEISFLLSSNANAVPGCTTAQQLERLGHGLTVSALLWESPSSSYPGPGAHSTTRWLVAQRTRNISWDAPLTSILAEMANELLSRYGFSWPPDTTGSRV